MSDWMEPWFSTCFQADRWYITQWISTISAIMGYTSSWRIVGETMPQAFKNIRCKKLHHLGVLASPEGLVHPTKPCWHVQLRSSLLFLFVWMHCLELRSVRPFFVVINRSLGRWFLALRPCFRFVHKLKRHETFIGNLHWKLKLWLILKTGKIMEDLSKKIPTDPWNRTQVP